MVIKIAAFQVYLAHCTTKLRFVLEFTSYLYFATKIYRIRNLKIDFDRNS